MKNRKLVLFITGLLVLVLLFQLSFTYFTKKTENNVKAMYPATNEAGYDKEAYAKHLDSISNTVVYNLGIVSFTYNECKSRELGLGLDLRGGMNVVLEVSKPEVLNTIAGDYNSKQPAFKKSIEEANAKAKQVATDYVDLFAEAYKKNSENKPLSIAFMTNENKGLISNKSSDDDVINYLKTEITDGIDRVYQVLETRLNQSTISQNTIQKLDGGRISVEIPGAENPERIRTLLERSAALEFWYMYGNNPKNGFMATRKMFDLDSILSTLPKYAKKTKADSLIGDSSIQAKGTASTLADAAVDLNKNKPEEALASADTASTEEDSAALATAKVNDRSFPIFELMSPNIGNDQFIPGPAIGYVPKYNLSKLKDILNSEEAKRYLPSDWRFAFDPKPSEAGFYTVYALKADKNGNATMSGDMIKNAYTDNDPSAGVVVSMTMTADAAEEWRLMTKNAASGEDDKKYIAVVLDGSVYSAPGVSEEIGGGSTQISGAFDLKEAQDLANVLKAGKLPVPLQIIAEDVVGPSLGKENISDGFQALLMGFIAIILFMIAYYHRAGFIADLAVIINVFFILGALASRGAALTLPGIAGLLLTIGMAVDANVLIYERIKEELLSGKTLKTSIQLGYKAAFSAILDANVTSLISGFILLTAGTGPVYGFAIILIIGIFSSLFTALLVSRLIIEGRAARGKDIKFETSLSSKILRNPNFDFVSGRKKYYIISGAVIVIGLVGLFSRGIPLGLDFKGGFAYTIQFDQNKEVNVIEVKNKISAIDKAAGSEVKKIGTNNKYKITTTYLIDNNDNETPEKVKDTVISVLSEFGITDASILESSKVGPTMASTARNKSFVVTILAILAMFFYIVIRFRNIGYGLGATVALLHDVLIVFGLYALLNGVVPFTLELDQTFIAALLTLIGYSINDTVIVFDRIRESMQHAKGTKTPLEVTINSAINQTLSRTLVTSGTTLLAVLLLFLFGGPGLAGFSFTLVVGILVGTYSSIFIATPIVVDVLKKKNQK